MISPYNLGGAAGAGIASTLIKRQLALEGTMADMVVDVTMGTGAYLFGGTLRGPARDVATGVVSGSAALIARNLPGWVEDMMGGGNADRRVTRRATPSIVKMGSSASPRSSGAAARGSVIEI
jgi:hypothetical protein